MSKRNPHITLRMEYGGKGKLLTEVVRASLHESNPSAMLQRIVAGIEAARDELDTAGDMVERDIMFTVSLRLRMLITDIRAKEDANY